MTLECGTVLNGNLLFEVIAENEEGTQNWAKPDLFNHAYITLKLVVLCTRSLFCLGDSNAHIETEEPPIFWLTSQMSLIPGTQPG